MLTSSQREFPANACAPKSSSTVNSPLTTSTAERVCVAPTWSPPSPVVHRENSRSTTPASGAPPSLSCPWYVKPLPANDGQFDSQVLPAPWNLPSAAVHAIG